MKTQGNTQAKEKQKLAEDALLRHDRRTLRPSESR